MLEIRDFKKRKNAGLLKMTMAGKMLILTHKQFDNLTGEEIQELSIPVEAEQIRSKLAELKKQTNSLQEMVDEIDKVEAEAKQKEEQEKAKQANKVTV